MGRQKGRQSAKAQETSFTGVTTRMTGTSHQYTHTMPLQGDSVWEEGKMKMLRRGPTKPLVSLGDVEPASHRQAEKKRETAKGENKTNTKEASERYIIDADI